MDAIPPDVAKKLLNRDFANLVKRVQAGGKISRAERAMLQSMAVGAGAEGPAFVRNYRRAGGGAEGQPAGDSLLGRSSRTHRSRRRTGCMMWGSGASSCASVD